MENWDGSSEEKTGQFISPGDRNGQMQPEFGGTGGVLYFCKGKFPRKPPQFQTNGVSMSQVCQVTGKRPVAGNRISHAHNKTKRVFRPNIHTKRFWLPSENRYVKLKLSAKGIKIINKRGIDSVVAELRKKGVKV